MDVRRLELHGGFHRLRQNRFFPVSAAAFCCLNAEPKIGHIAMCAVFVLAAIAAAALQPSIRTRLRTMPKSVRACAAVCAAGVCLFCFNSFHDYWSRLPKVKALCAKLPVPTDLSLWLGILGAAAAFWFVFVFMAFFLHKLREEFARIAPFADLTRAEIVVYALLMAIGVGTTSFVFLRTQAFYGTYYKYDVIFTSDSPLLVKGNAYLKYLHIENDLRQPLFAAFAAPFAAPFYLIARICNASPAVTAILLNVPQIALLLLSGLLLAKTLRLAPGRRLCFMLLAACANASLLFTLMMEQYAVALFYLMLLIALIHARQADLFSVCAAGGTLLTGVALLPLCAKPELYKKDDVSGVLKQSEAESNISTASKQFKPALHFKNWFVGTLRRGVQFGVVLLCARFDILVGLAAKLTELGGYTGAKLTLADRACQYFAFVRSCFLAPAATADYAAYGHATWQLLPVRGLSVAGAALLALALIGFIVNRRRRSSRIAALWALFSVLVLMIAGWGTQENGLILYSLYFGWPFLALIFQLAEALERKLNLRWLIPALCVLGCGAMLAVNLPALARMIRFAIACYPA